MVTQKIWHICMPESLKVKIASQLKAGVSIDKIMDHIQDVSLSEVIKCEHLVVKQDVYNIARTLNLRNTKTCK